MAFILNKTATDFLDLFNKLIQAATGRSCITAAINAGGTGYTVGDVLTVSGGTSTIAVELVVTAVSGGVITAVRISQSGVYTALPTNPVSVTGGTGTGATFNLTFNTSNGWIVQRRTKKATSATVGAGGSGYSVGNTLTVPNTSAEGTPSTWNVDTVDGGGAVTAVSLVTAGNYHETPANPAATTGGAGTGATLNVTYVDGTDETSQELILKGEGSGSDEVFVGIRTFVSGGNRNWELAGFTGYSSITPWSSQPGISPGRFDLATTQGQGAYVPLTNSTINYWLFINGRRIIGIFKISSTYTNMYLGFTNPFGTTLEFPYPLYVGGCSSLPGRNFASGDIGYSGALDPIGSDSHTFGPHFIRAPSGTWKTVKNSTQNGASRGFNDDLVVWPCGSPGKSGVATEDQIGSNVHVTTDVIPGTGNPGSQTDRLLQIPGSGINLSTLVPNMIIEEGDGAGVPRMVHGELDNLFWTTSNLDQDSTTALSEDIFVVGADRYHLFQNCNQTDQWKFFCVKEE